MSGVLIKRIDENKSRPSNSNPFYVLVLSEAPDANWKARLDELARRKPANNRMSLLNVRIENNASGAVMTLTTPASVTPEQMLEEAQALIQEVNADEDVFRQRIRELNEKLSSQNGGN